MFDPDRPETWPSEESQVEVIWASNWRNIGSLRFHVPLEVAREVMCFEQADFELDRKKCNAKGFDWDGFSGWIKDVIAWRYADPLPVGLSDFIKKLCLVDHCMSYKEYREKQKERHLIHEYR